MRVISIIEGEVHHVVGCGIMNGMVGDVPARDFRYEEAIPKYGRKYGQLVRFVVRWYT